MTQRPLPLLKAHSSEETVTVESSNLLEITNHYVIEKIYIGKSCDVFTLCWVHINEELQTLTDSTVKNRQIYISKKADILCHGLKLRELITHKSVCKSQ